MSADTKSFPKPSLRAAARVWWKIGMLSFGGPAAQIALMHKELVEDRAWLSEQQFLNALSFCMLLPGPEAMQLATYAGWRLHGTPGGLIAGLLFVLPGAAIIMALAAIYSLYGSVPLVQALFFGVKAAVLVIVVEALLRVAKKALGRWHHWLIAGVAFVAIFAFAVPYPVIVALAGLAGWVSAAKHPIPETARTAHVPMSQTARTCAVWLAIWGLPLLALQWLGAPGIFVQIGTFFSTLAVVTFGGAYAVLAYMAQDVVGTFGWLTAGEMIDALGLAETTPGPLILVTQFVSFLAGFQAGGLGFAVAAALVALWVTFVPCFLWIFAGAPYIDWLSGQPRLQGALRAITAAVVGVILNLSLWFALHVLFGTVSRVQIGAAALWWPDVATIDWLAAGLFGVSCLLAFRLHWGILPVLLFAACAGAGLNLLL